MRACYQSYPLALSKSFEEAMEDELLRRCIEMHARYGNPKEFDGEATGGKP